VERVLERAGSSLVDTARFVRQYVDCLAPGAHLASSLENLDQRFDFLSSETVPGEMLIAAVLPEIVDWKIERTDLTVDQLSEGNKGSLPSGLTRHCPCFHLLEHTLRLYHK